MTHCVSYSRATAHIVRNDLMTSKYDDPSNSLIKRGGAELVRAKIKGKTKASLAGGISTTQYNRVLNIPDIAHNLGSVSGLCDHGPTVSFKKDYCTMKVEETFLDDRKS